MATAGGDGGHEDAIGGKYPQAIAVGTELVRKLQAGKAKGLGDRKQTMNILSVAKSPNDRSQDDPSFPLSQRLEKSKCKYFPLFIYLIPSSHHVFAVNSISETLKATFQAFNEAKQSPLNTKSGEILDNINDMSKTKTSFSSG